MLNKNFLRIFISSALGNILEWYDFSLFAFLTPILAKLFFPHESPSAALFFTYAIFAIGFFMRPLGAILFGHLGDRIGRKKTLIFSILLMSTTTCLMGLIPTYEIMGIAAPILLILLRICQGLAVGGETTSAIIFAMESLPTNRKQGFLASMMWSMAGVGMLLGSYASTFVVYHPECWRIPFLLGILTGLIGYFVRKRTPESLLFQDIQQKNQLSLFPLWEGLRYYKKELLQTLGLFSLSSMITYLIYVFMPAYATTTLKFPLKETTLICTCTLTASTFLNPLGGFLADRVGKKTCLSLAALGFFLLSYELFHSMVSLPAFVISQICFVLLGINFQGPLATIFEIFPAKIRCTLFAVGYNLSFSIVGGTAPLIANYLVNVTGDKSAPGLYLMFGAGLALISALSLSSTRLVYLESNRGQSAKRVSAS